MGRREKSVRKVIFGRVSANLNVYISNFNLIFF